MPITLKANEIFASISNMIISQQFYGNRLAGLDSSLVSRFKTDGTLYGDTKLFYDADILVTHPWNGDSEASNLLALDRPADPKCQSITIDQFRQVRLTVDSYLSKRAWGDEGAFQNFTSIIQAMIGKTKRLYDTLLIDTYTGTVTSSSDKAVVEIDLHSITETGEEGNRLRAQTIARKIADLFVDMKSPSREYNDYKFMDAYNLSDLIVVWNSKYVNEITKFDLPTVFHNDGIVEKFAEEVLPGKYFGHVNSAKVTAAQNTVANKYRSTIETDYGNKHVFPGDVIPIGVEIAIGNAYSEGDDIICKIIHKDAIKYMSAFETSTEFFNPRSLTSNKYLTFGYSKPDYIKGLPVITVEED